MHLWLPAVWYTKLLAIADTLDNVRPQHEMLAEQLLRLVDTVYRPPTERTNEMFASVGENFEAVWKPMLADLGNLAVVWDAQTSRYVFAKDRSTLPVKPTK